MTQLPRGNDSHGRRLISVVHLSRSISVKNIPRSLVNDAKPRSRIVSRGSTHNRLAVPVQTNSGFASLNHRVTQVNSLVAEEKRARTPRSRLHFCPLCLVSSTRITFAVCILRNRRKVDFHVVTLGDASNGPARNGI